MAKTKESTLKAISKYNKEKTDEFKIRLPKGNKAILTQYCKEKGTNITALIYELLTSKLKEDGISLRTKEDVIKDLQAVSDKNN